MRTTISDELKMLDEMARDFAAKELVDEREEHDRFPFVPLYDSVLAKAVEVGFFAVMLPEEAGGSAEPVSALCVVLDEICQADASLGATIFTNALAQEIIRQAGGSGLLEEVTSEDGSFQQSLIAFPSYNNPGEVDHCAKAVKTAGGYELSGGVEYVVLGGVVNRALLPAKIEGMDGYSFFLVDLKSQGVEVSDPVLSLGMHSCPAVDLTLSGVPGTLVGAEGEGGSYFEAAVDRLSVAAAAMAAGVMKGSFTEAFEYSKQREQGGRHIVNWSGLRMILADMVLKAKVADMLVEKRRQGPWTARSRAGSWRRGPPPSRCRRWPRTRPPTASRCWAATAT